MINATRFNAKRMIEWIPRIFHQKHKLFSRKNKHDTSSIVTEPAVIPYMHPFLIPANNQQIPNAKTKNEFISIET